MHWNNGRFHGPVTLENSLNITDFKYNAIKYFDDKIIFGDNKVNSEINGDHIKINAKNSIIINDTSYGTDLPTDNLTEGRIFFKLIS